MRRTSKTLESIQAYLRSCFTAKAEEVGVDDVALWMRQLDGVSQSMQAYPACLVQILSRDCGDYHYTDLRAGVGIALRGEEPEALEELGHTWEDIVEDVIREDRTLGDSVISTNALRVDSSFTSGMYMIWADMICSV